MNTFNNYDYKQLKNKMGGSNLKGENISQKYSIFYNFT